MVFIGLVGFSHQLQMLLQFQCYHVSQEIVAYDVVGKYAVIGWLRLGGFTFG